MTSKPPARPTWIPDNDSSFPQIASWLEVSASALKNNLALFRRLLDQAENRPKLGVVLKGNAYGHGLRQVLTVVHSQVDAIFVVTPQEALAIRQLEKELALSQGRVVVLGGVGLEEALWLAQAQVEVAVADSGFEQMISGLRGKLSRPLKVHVFIDSGLGREGFVPEELKTSLKFLENAGDLIQVVGALAHFANAEDPCRNQYPRRQLQRFSEGVETLEQMLDLQPGSLERHTAASAASLVFPQARADLIRVGISLYGFWPADETRVAFQLQREADSRFDSDLRAGSDSELGSRAELLGSRSELGAGSGSESESGAGSESESPSASESRAGSESGSGSESRWRSGPAFRAGTEPESASPALSESQVGSESGSRSEPRWGSGSASKAETEPESHSSALSGYRAGPGSPAGAEPQHRPVSDPESAESALPSGFAIESKAATDSTSTLAPAIPTDLMPVLAWRCVSQVVKTLSAGSYVGYGCTHRVARDTRVAVLPVGYYEGYPRLLSGKAHVLVNGVRAPVLGRVMMNHIVVDITEAVDSQHIPSDSSRVVATLLGQDGEEHISAELLASWAKTIHYEIVTRIGAHLRRVVVP